MKRIVPIVCDVLHRRRMGNQNKEHCEDHTIRERDDYTFKLWLQSLWTQERVRLGGDELYNEGLEIKVDGPGWE